LSSSGSFPSVNHTFCLIFSHFLRQEPIELPPETDDIPQPAQEDEFMPTREEILQLAQDLEIERENINREHVQSQLNDFLESIQVMKPPARGE